MVAIWSTRSGNSQFHCPDLHHNTISHWQADCFTLLLGPLVYRPGQQLRTYVCLGWVTLQVGARKQNKKMRKCFFLAWKGRQSTPYCFTGTSANILFFLFAIAFVWWKVEPSLHYSCLQKRGMQGRYIASCLLPTFSRICVLLLLCSKFPCKFWS